MTDIFNGMTNRYKLKKDLTDRLHSTICRYKGVPVLVSVTSASKFTLSDLSTGKIKQEIPINDPDLDISSPNLGYVNKPNNMSSGINRSGSAYSVYYIIRMPMKRYYQGLNHRVIEVTDIEGTSKPYDYINLYSSYVNDMLSDVYPPFDMFFDTDETIEIAVSRDIAMKKMDSGVVLVFLKGKNIGWINPKERKILIPYNEFSWVTERYLTKYKLPFNQIG